MKKITSSVLLKIVFVIAIAIMLFISAIIYRHINTITDTSAQVKHAYEVTLEIEQLYTYIKDLEIERRNFLLTNNNSLINDINITKIKINNSLQTLSNLISDNPQQIENTKKLEQLVKNKFNVVDKILYHNNLLANDPTRLRDNLLEGKELMSKIRFLINNMLTIENNLLDIRRKDNISANKFTPFIIYITLFSTLGLITLAFIKISRDLDYFKFTTNELKLSNELSKLAENIGNFGVWKWDIKKNKYHYSDNIYRILGNEPQGFPETLEGFMSHIHPDDLEYVNSKVATMIQTNSFTPFKYRIVRNDNKEIRYFFANNRLIENEFGEQYLLGTTSDITEQVQNELAIEQRNTELEKFNNDLLLSNEANDFGEKIGKYGNWQWDIKQDKWYFSDNLYRLLGAEPRAFEANLENFFKYMHPEDLDYVKEKAAEMSVIEDLPAFNYRVQRPSGEIIFVKSLGRPVFDKNGNKLLAGMTQDITDDVIAAEEINHQNKQLQRKNAILSVALQTSKNSETTGNFGTWQWLIDENKFYFSDNMYRLFGFEPQKFENPLEHFITRVHPDDVAIVEERVQEMNTTKTFEPFIHRIIRANDNQTRYISINNKLINDETVGEYLLVVTIDITEDVLKNQDIAKQNKILEATNKELQAFNYVASHDLQEPLRKIQTFISRLKDKELNNLTDSGKEYLSRITSSAERMRTLIDDLLQFSRTTRTEKNYETCDLNQLVDNAKSDLAQTIEEKHAIINVAELPTLPVIPFQIQQLFTNFIGNSLKYSKPNVPPIIDIQVAKVAATTEEIIPKNIKSKFYKISIQDNGIGFEQQYAERIFTLFSRLHNKDEYAGTGIGLAICKKIVENHNGYITASGIPDKGSVFTVYLPENQ